MNNKHTNKLKSKKYIYTEQDLGEGLLDAGVVYPFVLENTGNFTNEFIGNNEIPSTILMEVPNVQDDFTYVYYC